MNKYGLHSSLKAKPGQGETLANLLLKSASLNTMKGCQVYIISQDVENKDIIWITEVWDTKEDHDNSLKLESVRELIAQAMPILDGMPQKGLVTEVLGGTGIN